MRTAPHVPLARPPLSLTQARDDARSREWADNPRPSLRDKFGPGSVIGKAPSAAAAEVLADSLGIPAENTAKWLTEWGRTRSE